MYMVILPRLMASTSIPACPIATHFCSPRPASTPAARATTLCGVTSGRHPSTTTKPPSVRWLVAHSCKQSGIQIWRCAWKRGTWVAAPHVLTAAFEFLNTMLDSHTSLMPNL
jgi:hypothetical protein